MDRSWDHAWEDTALDAAIAELAERHIGPACTVLAEARTQPELRSLRVEQLADRLVGAGGQVLSLAMDNVNPDLSLLAGTIAVREAHVIADRPRDPDAAKMVHAYLRRAVGPLTQAAELVDTDPVPHYLLQIAAAVLNPKECDRAWAQAVKRAPTLYSAHRTKVDVLAPEAALTFARETARAAGSGDPRVALVVHAHNRMCAARAGDYRKAGKTAEGAERNARWDQFGSPRAASRDEIAGLSQRFLAAARTHPRTIEAHNLFAAAFTAMGWGERAEPHLRVIAGRSSGWAWAPVGGAEAYEKAVRGRF